MFDNENNLETSSEDLVAENKISHRIYKKDLYKY